MAKVTVRTVNLQVHPSGKIIELSNGGCPYKSHLYDLEEEQGIEGDILYAIFPDTNGINFATLVAFSSVLYPCVSVILFKSVQGYVTF